MKKVIFENLRFSPNSLKKLFVFLILPLFVFACSSTKKIKKPPVFNVVETTLAKGIKDRGNEGVPINPTASFNTQDDQVVSHIKYVNLTGKHHLRWEWYRPDGKLYYKTKKYSIRTSKNTYVKEGSSSHRISIKGTKATKYLGTWKVKIFLDDRLYASNYFKINKKRGVKKIQPVAKVETPNFSDINFGNYHALVIGNNDYQYIRGLASAKNDAKGVARLLKDDYGFKVKLVINATRVNILGSLRELRNSMGNQDNLLIYYAGHGWLDEEADEGYWLPVDAEPDNKFNWVSNSTITSYLKAIQAKHILIVADSCYAGKLTRGIRVKISLRDYFARSAKKKARSVLTSGGLEPVVDSGGEGGYSVFTSAFIDALKENQTVLDTTELFNRILRPVKLQADQTPEYSDIRKAGHEGGDFLFVKREVAKVDTER